MIEEYLKEKAQNEEYNTFNMLEACEGETWHSTLELDDITVLIVFKSGCSLTLWTNGAKRIMNKETTLEEIDRFYSESQPIAKSFLKVNKLLQSKQENKPRGESDGSDTKTT